MGRLLLAVAALLMSGFGTAEVREIPSPAGPGSGQPNLVAGPDGRIYLSWLEQAGDANRLRLRRVRRDGSLAPAVTVEAAAAVRANAFPQLARDGDTLVVAWTDERVRTATLSPIP